MIEQGKIAEILHGEMIGDELAAEVDDPVGRLRGGEMRRGEERGGERRRDEKRGGERRRDEGIDVLVREGDSLLKDNQRYLFEDCDRHVDWVRSGDDVMRMISPLAGDIFHLERW